MRPGEAVDAVAARLVDQALWDGAAALWCGDDVVVDADGTASVAYRSVGGDLYGGTAGIALFLARHAAAGGGAQVRRAAAGAARHAVEWVGRTRPDGSLLAGAGGVALAVLEAARLLGDPSLLDGGLAAARWAVDHPPSRGGSPACDLVGGLAGHVLALLRIGDEVDDAELADDASRAADAAAERLLAAAVPGPAGGLGWPSDLGDPAALCGLAHGASGPALALVEWGVRRGRPDAMATAAAATDYERSWYSAEHGTWADLREITSLRLRRGEHPAWPHLWCHGSLGIGTQRLRHHELTGAEVYLAEAGVAIDAASRAVESLADAPAPDLSLCHGLGGALELLLDAARALGQPVLSELARDGAEAALDLVGDGPWPCGIPDGGENPSLFVGLAGIGAVLQRLDDPALTSTVRAYADRAMPSRVIVKLTAAPDADAVGRLVAAAGEAVPGARVERVSHTGRVLLRLPVDADVAAAVELLRRLDNVEWAEADVEDRAVDG